MPITKYSVSFPSQIVHIFHRPPCQTNRFPNQNKKQSILIKKLSRDSKNVKWAITHRRNSQDSCLRGHLRYQCTENIPVKGRRVFEKHLYLRNIMCKSTIEVVAVWLRLSFLLDVTSCFKPRSRFAQQVGRSDVKRDMTQKTKIFVRKSA